MTGRRSRTLVGSFAAAALLALPWTSCGPDDSCEVTLTCPTSGSGASGQGGGSGGAGGVGGGATLMNGEPCAAASECASGQCADGVCCDVACDAVCQSCSVADSEGTCTAHASGSDPEGDCAPGSCDASGQCATGEHVWSFKYGNAGSQAGDSVAVDAMGNVVLAGEFDGSVDFGSGQLTSAGGSDIYVAKQGADGASLWMRGYGDTSIQRAKDVAVTTNGSVVLVAEIFSTVDFGGGPLTSAGQDDIAIVKLGSDGSYQWAKHFGDSSGQKASAIAAADNGAIITGRFAGSVNFGGGQTFTAEDFGDIYVAKFSINGGHVWSREYGVSGSHDPYDVAVDTLGEVIVVGGINGQVDFGGGVKSSLQSDVFVLKLDAGGNYLWDKEFGSGQYQQARGVATDSDRNIVIVGDMSGSADFGGGDVLTSFDGDPDVFVAKYDRDGTHLWSKNFGTAGEDFGYGVAVDGDGNVFITGQTESGIDLGGGLVVGNRHLFIAKYDPDGNHLWSRVHGNDARQVGNSIATDASGNALAIGSFRGTINFGGQDLTSFDATANDIYLTKLAP